MGGQDNSEKMQTCEIVRIHYIMQDMKQNFFVGTSVARAWKKKLIAKKIIKGGVDKKCANLWRYDAELTSVNSRHIVKINVERLMPSIQPRFG